MGNEEQNFEFCELRENIVFPNQVKFKRKIFGGCNVKEVYDHVEFMNDRLYHAELSFRNRLEEFSTMAAMLTQDKKNLGDKLLQAQSYQNHFEQKLREKEAEIQAVSEKYDLLHSKLNELEEMKDNSEATVRLVEEQRRQIADCKANNAMLSESNAQLQMTVEELSEKLEKERCGVSLEKYQEAILACEHLQDQYNAAATEQEIIIAEKNEILERSKATADSLYKMHEENKDLWSKNVRQNIEMRKLISIFETKAHEVSHNQMQNIDKIRSSIKDILDILDCEGANILKLIQCPYEKQGQDTGNDIELKDAVNYPKLYELHHERSAMKDSGEG